MSVCLRYESATNCRWDLRQKIRDRIASSQEHYQWWCEPIYFFNDDADHKSRLSGSTKLYCIIEDQSVDKHMAHLDILKIVEFLKSASSEFSTDWVLSLEDKELGAIESGEPCDDLEFHLDMLADVHGYDPEQFPSRDDVLAAFPDR